MGLNLCQHRDQPIGLRTLLPYLASLRSSDDRLSPLSLLVMVMLLSLLSLSLLSLLLLLLLLLPLLLLCENSLEGEKERARERERGSEREGNEKSNKGATGVPGHVCGQHACRHRSADDSPWTEVGQR